MGRLHVCVLPCVLTGKECLLMSGVSDVRGLGYSFVHWLIGGIIDWLLVA